jgi:hypothetical protein
MLEKIKSVEQIGEFEDEWVYDLEIDDEDSPDEITQTFFANDILVHNSCFFSAWKYFKDNKIQFGWTKEDVTALYDEVARQTNDSFPDKMNEMFHSGIERGSIIQAGRELVGTRGLFVAKKRYAVLIYDSEGKRVDVDGKSGKLKVMGLEIKRSDTAKVIQDFLEECVEFVLAGGDNEGLKKKIQDFRVVFKSLPAWEKGTPKASNKLTAYTEEFQKLGKKAKLPGHIRASVNWNMMADMHNDRMATKITDGSRIIVCKLKANNPLNMTSIAYPVDEERIPSWFKTLPFDEESMENGTVEQKLSNIFSVLEWDLQIGEAAHTEVVNKMFTF